MAEGNEWDPQPCGGFRCEAESTLSECGADVESPDAGRERESALATEIDTEQMVQIPAGEFKIGRFAGFGRCWTQFPRPAISYVTLSMTRSF